MKADYDSEEKIEELAKYVTLNFLDEDSEIRKQCLIDLESQYMGKPIVYLLQNVGVAIYSFFVSVAANFFYDWCTKSKRKEELENCIKKAFIENYNEKSKEIEEHYKKLVRYLEEEKNSDKEDLKIMEGYKKTIAKLRKKEQIFRELTNFLYKNSEISLEEIEEFLDKYRDF